MATVKVKAVKMKTKWAYSELSSEQKKDLREEFMTEYNCEQASFYNKINGVSECSPSEIKWLTAKLAVMMNEENLELTF